MGEARSASTSRGWPIRGRVSPVAAKAWHCSGTLLWGVWHSSWFHRGRALSLLGLDAALRSPCQPATRRPAVARCWRVLLSIAKTVRATDSLATCVRACEGAGIYVCTYIV